MTEPDLQTMRADLASTISEALMEAGMGAYPPGTYFEVADAIIAAGWRKVAAVGEAT